MIPRYLAPQLAWGDGSSESAEPFFISDRYVGQEKLDGIRYIVHYDLDGVVRIYSRRTSDKNGLPVEKTGQLAHIAREVMDLFPPGTVLDGEVIVDIKGTETISSEVTKITGCTPENALARQHEHGFAKYAVFDILYLGGKSLLDTPMIERHIAIRTALLTWGKHLSRVPLIVGERTKRKQYAKIVARGGEGLILKDTDAIYVPGKRWKAWVKVKKEFTDDVVFMGVEMAKEKSTKKSGEISDTKFKGLAGAIVFGQYARAREKTEIDVLFRQEPPSALTRFGTCSGFDDNLRNEITEHANFYTEKQLVFEIKHNGRLKSGSFRHPRFVRWRDDKDAADCVYTP